MNTLTVELGARSYPILIGPGLLDNADILEAHVPRGNVLLVSNTTVAPLYGEALKRGLNWSSFTWLTAICCTSFCRR